jgi:hypothetical protein
LDYRQCHSLTHEHGDQDSRQKTVQANSEHRECSRELIACGDLCPCNGAAGDASRKAVGAPVSDLAFVRAVELGSFSKAAVEGGAKVSTVSRLRRRWTRS